MLEDLTRAALMSPAERAELGVGANNPPCLTREPAAVPRWVRQGSRRLNEYFFMGYLTFFESQVRSWSGHRSKLSLFALSVNKTGLTKDASPNLCLIRIEEFTI